MGAASMGEGKVPAWPEALGTGADHGLGGRGPWRVWAGEPHSPIVLFGTESKQQTFLHPNTFSSAQDLRKTLTGSVTVLGFPSPERILSLAVAMQSALPSDAAFTSGPHADGILGELLAE